jgi:GntR family transcriptional regulator / MocR family aminotransferase
MSQRQSMAIPGRLPLEIDKDAPERLQMQLFYGIQRLIIRGLLKPGQVLPSFREMARQLGVSKNTVILAYERLICEGYLETRPGVGTFVSPDIPEHALQVSQQVPDPEAHEELMARRHPLLFHGHLHEISAHNRHRARIDFAVGEPEPANFPAQAWKLITGRKLDHRHGAMSQYRDPAGLIDLRAGIADWLGPTRGMNVSAEQVIIVGGAQEALNLISRLLVASETRVAVESPCYQGASYVFQAARAKIVPVPVDSHGLDPGELPKEPVSLIYVTPSHQYPLGSTLTLERRLRLLEWAWNSGAYIVEDDYDSDFRYTGSPLFALAALDRHESVIYLGTFSKSIGPGLRVGYIVAPTALVKPLVTLKGLLNNGNAWVEQAVLAEFIASGGFASHLRKVRRMYHARQKVLIETIRAHFGTADVAGHEAGMHLVWTLPEGAMPAEQLARRAGQHGIGLYPLAHGATSFAESTEGYERKLMLGFTAVPEDDIREAFSVIARILRDG